MLLSDKVILQKIVSEINLCLKFVDGIQLNDFLNNILLQHAVAMTIIIIGEFVKRLSIDFRTANPQVAWRDLAGFRDIVAHRYETLRMPDVYDTVKQDLPVIKTQILEILTEADKQ